MLKILIDSGKGFKDYTRYVAGETLTIQRSLNVPSTCTFTMWNFDNAFVMPSLRSYVRIFSTKYNRTLFSGFITVDPTRSYQGVSAGAINHTFKGQIFSLQYNCTSDEYLLNLKSVQFIPAFVNQTQGQILQTIAETLCPGFFDYTYIASGQLVPFMEYDGTKSWSEYAKQFADASRYRYSVVDKQIHYQIRGDDLLGIKYDENAGQSTFDPYSLQTSALTVPVVNDILVIGNQEAGSNHEDYFIGDGFTGSFPLRHQVFNGGGSPNGGKSGSVVLVDNWTEDTFDLQTWFVQDPTNDFTLGNNLGALNILTGVDNLSGESYILANNGIELAGGLVLQHGEFTFQGVCSGSIIGGIYDDVNLEQAKCEAGFDIEASASVVISASGTSGLLIRPFRLGAFPDKAFEVTTKLNHTYILSTIVHAPAPARYTQIYTTLAGSVFGGASLQPNVVGSVTWRVTEIDQFSGLLTDYAFTLDSQSLPSFGVYALCDNVHLNLSVTNTYIYLPPLGSLYCACKIGSGLLAPIYISGNVQYTGAFVEPSGGNLPILPGDFGPENQFPLGISSQNQAAEVDLGTNTSTLNFYSDDLPGVGVKIRLQSWESQAAISRIQNSTSISGEASVVGDDGIRSSMVQNLNPMPRTSEDADAAAQAFLTDRGDTFYEGTYNASYLFFSQNTSNLDFYPVCGRYLYVNAPSRNINKQNLFVTSVTTKVVELTQEIMEHNISFGPDLYLEKVLANFVTQPASVLLPQDTSKIPTPQQLAQVGANFLEDVTVSKFDTLAISGSALVLNLVDNVPVGAFYELRSADLNWGKNDNYLLARYTTNQNVTLQRTSFEQIWYLRFVDNSNPNSIKVSRRSKVLRVFMPMVPLQPAFLYADSSIIAVDFNGDIRNIEGVELRAQDDVTVYYDAIVGSEFDMQLNLDQISGRLPAFSITGGYGYIGQYLKGQIPVNTRNFVVHFFNTMWEFSPGLSVYIPPPTGLVIDEGYRFGASLEVRLTSVPNRTDILTTSLQLSSTSGFDTIFLQQDQPRLPKAFHVQIPVSGDMYARAVCIDHISSGDWSNTLHIPIGNLIASDYLTGQGSAPPTVDNILGSLFTYTAVAATPSITWSWPVFNVLFPNGVTTAIASGSIYFSGSGMVAGSGYYFYPYLQGGPNGLYSSNGTAVNILGPYSGSNLYTPLMQQNLDGRVPLSAGGVLANIPAGGSGGGGGGGTGGGGNGGCPHISVNVEPLEHAALWHLEEAEDWVEIEVDELYSKLKPLRAVPEHQIFSKTRGKIFLRDVEIGEEIITKKGLKIVTKKRAFKEKSLKVFIDMPIGHLYWANDYLSDNNKPFLQ